MIFFKAALKNVYEKRYTNKFDLTWPTGCISNKLYKYARPSGNPHIIFVIKSHFYCNPENPKLANPGLEKAKTSCFAEHC